MNRPKTNSEMMMDIGSKILSNGCNEKCSFYPKYCNAIPINCNWIWLSMLFKELEKEGKSE